MKNIYLVLGLLTVMMAFQCTQDKNITGPVLTDISYYNFESGLTDNWVKSSYKDSLGVEDVAAVSSRSAVGDYSLKLEVHLVSGSDNLAKGEAFVDMRRHKPFGWNQVPVDLNQKTVSLWTYVPAKLKGEFPTAPNGLQVFVKDNNYKSWYSEFIKVGTTIPTNSWYKLEIDIDEDEAAYKDADVDLTKVIILGVKIGTADSSSNVSAHSAFYIDAIYWD